MMSYSKKSLSLLPVFAKCKLVSCADMVVINYLLVCSTNKGLEVLLSRLLTWPSNLVSDTAEGEIVGRGRDRQEGGGLSHDSGKKVV